MTRTLVQRRARGLFSSRGMASRGAASLLFGGSLLLVSQTAMASAQNPGLLQEAAGMPCAPTCAICHETAQGGKDTATQPFSRTMLSNGYNLNDDESIAKAVSSLETYNVVTDQERPADPTTGNVPNDVVWLQAGLDPNGILDKVCVPDYGCGAAHVAPQAREGSALPWGIAAAVLALSLFLRRRLSASVRRAA